MNVDLISKSLCFHGQPLQKIWEGERGNNDLTRLGIANPDFSIYTARQKNLTFQDRAKRLKLHQFIARNASTLFDGTLIEDIPSARRKDKSNAYPVVLPPYEAFLSKSVDKSKHLAEVLEVVQPGDIVYGMVLSRTAYGVVIKLLCTGEPICRYLGDIIIKAYVLTQNLVPAHDKKGNVKVFAANDYVCCEVLELSADADRMILGMKGTLTIDAKAPLGLIYAEQLPEYYRVLKANDGATLEELLQKSKAFQNPNCVDLLFQECGLDPNEICSNIPSLKNRFPQQEYANELRQIQASKWAFRSVADGIEHFKVGRHSEAFQCLNKALNIDPRNVEGLVARGALYANSGSFKKAVDDFETALKLNPYHANARKYMGETLVALGRSYEEENRIDEARKAYMDCLNIIPHHEDAKSSLDFLNSKTGQGKQLINANELALPDSFSASSANRKDNDHKKSSKKSSKNKKRRESSSSSSSNESSDSDSNSSESTSSSDSSSSSSDSESSTERSKNKKKHRNRKRSLSPLSKRMALMDEQNPPSAATRYQFNQPFHLASTSTATSSAHDDYDSKVRNFLNISTEDEDYESRVRKLIEDASKHKKERKSIEKSKKDKKKQKKMKKESKKDKRRKEKSKNHSDVGNLDNMELKEALKILKTLPVSNSGGKSIKDDLMECQKYEQIVDLLQKRKENSSAVPVEQKPVPVAYAARSHSQNMYEMENHHYQPPYISKPQSPPPAPPVRKPTTPPPPPPVVERPRLVVPMHIAPVKPPVVLDKFGSFRLASAFEDTSKDLPSTSRKSKSNSPRDRYSRSRSSSRSRSRYRRRSRSPRRSLSRSGRRSRSLRRSVSRRRSRSRSIRRSRSRSLRRSRSRRRSYSRRRSFSRSNRRRFSRSPVRRRSRSAASPDRRWRSSRSRSRSISSRSGSRSPFDDRRGGRRRGAFRGSRGGFGGRGFRGGRGRGGRRGGGGFRGGRRSPFFRGRRGSRDDRDSRPRDDRSSDEDDSSKRRGGGAGRDRDKDKDGGIDGKWTHDKYEKPKPMSDNDEENWDDNPTKSNNAADPSVEEIDKIIDKAQKERKEDILQRDKDLLKKPTPNNLPF